MSAAFTAGRGSHNLFDFAGRARINATYGGASSLTYITESGKEIPAAFD